MIIVVTASNNVYALHAANGAVIWSRTNIGPAVTSGLPCGNINPVGIIGTPVVDLASRSLFFDALISGNPIKHFIYSLNVDTGATHADWPVDLNNAGFGFTSLAQEERGALALVNGIVYVPFPDTSVTAPAIMAGWSACISTILPWLCGWATAGPQRWYLGALRSCQRWHKHVRDHREHLKQARETHGAAAKPLFVCKRVRSLVATLPTSGRLQIGSHSTAATLIWAVAAPSSSMYQAQRLRSWFSP